MKPVILRPAAEADLLAIAMFIGEEGPERAMMIVARLRSRCLSLGAHPEMGRLRPEFGQGIRGLWGKPYLEPYHVTDAAAEILTFVHGAMDLPAAVAARLGSDA
jgi:toxin ParE1/3/4